MQNIFICRKTDEYDISKRERTGLLSLFFLWGKRGAAAVALLLVMLLSNPALAAERIDAVTAVVSGQSIPSSVRKRMETTIEAIAGQLLLGRPVEAVLAKEQRAANEELIRTVFDKVLIGYSVTGVSCVWTQDTGTAQVNVSLMPWDATISSLEITTEVEGLTPIIADIVRRDLAGIETVFKDSLIGLPVAASDWSNGVVKKQLNEYMNQRLPEFRADFDIESDDVSKVRIVVYPRVPIVRSVDLCMRSDTLPNFSLLAFRDKYQEKVGFLTGVPVAFVRRHERELADILAASLDKEPALKALRAKTKVTITGGERLTVMSRTDSERYHVRIDGWADIGHRDKKSGHDSDRDLRFRLRAGYLPNSKNEFFTQLDFFPMDAAARFDLGYRYAFDGGEKVWGELRYDFHHRNMVYGISYDFLPKWRLSYEYRRGEHLGEARLRYRLHDFLAVEYAIDKNDNWVRLVGFF